MRLPQPKLHHLTHITPGNKMAATATAPNVPSSVPEGRLRPLYRPPATMPASRFFTSRPFPKISARATPELPLPEASRRLTQLPFATTLRLRAPLLATLRPSSARPIVVKRVARVFGHGRLPAATPAAIFR